jgi:hypothetical protein
MVFVECFFVCLRKFEIQSIVGDQTLPDTPMSTILKVGHEDFDITFWLPLKTLSRLKTAQRLR